MYHTTLPSLQRHWLTVNDSDFGLTLATSARAQYDMTVRMTLLRAEPHTTVTLKGHSEGFDDARNYWEWYAASLKTRITWVVDQSVFPDYPAVSTPLALFTSESETGWPTGGIESTIGRHQLYNPLNINLNLNSYSHKRIGMLEGAIAIYAAAYGIGTAFIGDERYSGSDDRSGGVESFSDRYSLEQTESWWQMWNAYVGPQNSIQSLVGIWHKDELIAKAYELEGGTLARVTSCEVGDDTGGSAWCGDCWKCYSTKAVLDYKGLDSSFIALTDACIRQAQSEYKEYKDSGKDPYRSCGLLDRVSPI